MLMRHRLHRTREREKTWFLPLQRDLVEKIWPILTYYEVRDRAKLGDDPRLIMP